VVLLVGNHPERNDKGERGGPVRDVMRMAEHDHECDLVTVDSCVPDTTIPPMLTTKIVVGEKLMITPSLSMSKPNTKKEAQRREGIRDRTTS
jgi:hypothetical protein